MQVKNIMTDKVLSLTDQHTLFDAHQLTSNKGIRHIPVLAKVSGKLMGIITQKALLAHVMKLVGQVGTDKLETEEMRVPITQVVSEHFQTLSPEQEASEAGEYFLAHKHGCLPVMEGDKLVGIVTSSDFVRLSLDLLKQLDTKGY